MQVLKEMRGLYIATLATVLVAVQQSSSLFVIYPTIVAQVIAAVVASSSESTGTVPCIPLSAFILIAVMTTPPADPTSSNNTLLDAIQRLEDHMDERMTQMKKELAEEREQSDERLVKRMKLEKAPAFKRKSHEVQYLFNEDVKSKFESIKVALREAPAAVEKANFAMEEGEKIISDRQKLIRIVDRSEHGWATVEEYEDDELADNSDDEKKLFKAEARAGRKLRQKFAKGKVKKPIRKPGGWWNRQRQPNGSVEWNGGMEWWNGTVEWNSGMEWWNSGMTTPVDRFL